MKRLVLVALLCGCWALWRFAETEDEARAALQNTLMELEETYGAELLPEEQMQLSFLIDWADRYVESEQWAQFAEDFRAMPGRPKAFGAAQYGLHGHQPGRRRG